MAALSQRLGRLFSARAHHGVDKLEDPESMFSQLQRELATATIRAQAARQRSQHLVSKADSRAEALQRREKQLTEAAMQALRGGEQDIAREAVEERCMLQQEQQELSTHRQACIEVVQQQGKRLEELRAELKRTRQRSRLLLQRHRFANVLSGNGMTTDAAAREPVSMVMDRIENSISEQESSVNAHGDSEGVTGNRVDQYILSEQIEAGLDQLRSQL